MTVTTSCVLNADVSTVPRNNTLPLLPQINLVQSISTMFVLTSMTCLLATPVTASASEKPAPLPNIIVMMADDMGIGDTSAFQDWTGNADAVQVRTPNMERLARMGIRFTDAHSPSSRCSATRYALLTGRYSWRTRLKFSVLWGPQGDPLIPVSRPTIASLLQSAGYRTGMSGKWHVGLTYRDADGRPESRYQQVDLRRGIADGPLNHGFDFFHGTSRSHPTSAAQGWLSGDQVTAATGGREVDRSRYVLNETGPKNFEMASRFLDQHFADSATAQKPFFLYYACHSNHTSHNPAREINGVPVKNQSHPGGRRSDFIYENDVVLGQLLQRLQETDDPRRPGQQLIDNTLVIFTSDNGAENRAKTATGPLRSNKGSVYEGGHRVPFIAAWKAGQIGDGRDDTPGQTSHVPLTHVDLFATFAQITGQPVPSVGGEDSTGMLAALQGDSSARPTPLLHNDHKEAAQGSAKKPEAAWLAIRMDNPVADGKVWQGQWKLMVDEGLLLRGVVNPRELYNLSNDLREQTNLVDAAHVQPLVSFLSGRLHRIHNQGRLQ